MWEVIDKGKVYRFYVTKNLNIKYKSVDSKSVISVTKENMKKLCDKLDTETMVKLDIPITKRSWADLPKRKNIIREICRVIRLFFPENVYEQNGFLMSSKKIDFNDNLFMTKVKEFQNKSGVINMDIEPSKLLQSSF